MSAAAGRRQPPRAVLFDYGGVLAEEGFVAGLTALALRHGHDPEAFVAAGAAAVYSTGYVLGHADEAAFWRALRGHFPLPSDDAALSAEVLRRFVLRPRLLAAVQRLRQAGVRCAILSDQTDWLDRLEARDHFFGLFERTFNSFHLGRGKRDGGLFDSVCAELGLAPAEVLFVDDNAGHIERAHGRGLQALHFLTPESALAELEVITGIALAAPTVDGNLFAALPDASAEERFDTVRRMGGARLERIVSGGQASPAGFWYEQAQDEWVLLLEGAAELRFEDDDLPVLLRPGDYLYIAAGRRHRVQWTLPASPTVWFAVHVG